MGQVAEAFDEATLEKLPGHLAIGHTRYSTAGESKLENAQPFLIDCAHGQIAVAHNGNLVNARELRDELVRDGSIFQTGSDTEVILHLYARSKAPTVEDAIVESIAQVRGAYSLALLTQQSADRGARSERVPSAGARPAGRRLDRLLRDVRARSDRRDVRARRRAGRGRRHHRSRGCDRSSRFRRSRSSHCVFEHVYFARPDSYVFGSSVNEVRTEFGRTLALRGPRRRRRRRADPRLRRLRGDRFRGGGGAADEDGPDPQPLRRPDVHRAAAVHPPLQREGEAESGSQHPRGQAGRSWWTTRSCAARPAARS